MQDFKNLFSLIMNLANTRLSFGSFHFTIFQAWCAFFAISIISYFIWGVFDD